MKKHTFSYLKNDMPSNIVVLFVALPLYLGVALEIGATLFSGLIAGIVVGFLNGSKIGVSGPAFSITILSKFLTISPLKLKNETLQLNLYQKVEQLKIQ